MKTTPGAALSRRVDACLENQRTSEVTTLSVSPGVDRDQPGPPIRDGPSPKVVFSIVALALFMGSVDLTIVATALPAIHQSLAASINWVGWTITIYGLTTVVTLPIAGKFANQFGRRRVFLIGVSLFTVSSLACGLSHNIYMLIVFRAFQAIGGGAFQPSAAGIVSDHFGQARDRAIGMFSSVLAAGQVIGPVLGGVLVGYLSWRWIFFVNVPIGVVLVVMTKKIIPETTARTGAKTDTQGLVLIGSCILAAVIGVTNFGSGHEALYDLNVVVPEASAVVLAWLFIRHTNRASDPFIAMRLLRGKGFAVMNALNLLQGLVTFGIVSLVPLYAEQRYHIAALGAGTLLTSRAVGSVSVGALATFALRRTGYRLPLMVGFSVIGAGTFMMSIGPRFGLSPFVWLSIFVGVTGLGLGTVNPAASNASLQLAPDEVAAITGLRSMFLNLGVIIAVSLTTAILNRSGSPGITQSHVLWAATAVVALVMLPLITRVPEHKGSW